MENNDAKITEDALHINVSSKKNSSNTDSYNNSTNYTIDSSCQPAEPDFNSKEDYELIDNVYYYNDPATGTRYKYNASEEKWEEVSTNTEVKVSEQVTTDEEGRQYYYADGKHLCRDPHGNTFFLDENNEWKTWGEIDTESMHSEPNREKTQSESRWYFYRGENTFYRDTATNKVYKLNKETNSWEIYEQKKSKKRKTNSDEEFDTDDDAEDDEYYYSDDEVNNGDVPPGYKSDPNISFNGQIYTKLDLSDNMTFEWDVSKKAWFPKIDEDFMASYQLSYGFNPDGTKNENPLKFDDDADEEDEKVEEIKNKEIKGNAEKKTPGWFDMEDAHNTKVYVSNLPTEITENELVDFMQKCGLLLKDLETQKFKIKMYKDNEGNFKGDALCTYIKKESVELALQILDEYRYGSNIVKVERAKFTLKGEYDPTLKPKKKRKKDLDKLQKKQEKLFDWRPDPLRGQRMKHENVVILRNVFDPKEFEGAAEKIFTHKEAIQNMVETFGPVKKIELFDRHPEGVAKVTFVEVEIADMCVSTINNRLYQKRKLIVSTWDGAEKYNIEETAEERAERIRKWEEFLATTK